ncbi:MAG: hypothetical protein H6662_06590 [Ardenticatenaceae bacterium]|nr:hypothetical protein [Ardenticatenaceae bacterium]MCB8990598.1 hypothetical protein [Ardenticatenaceae bacterium]MCB9004305.1 hypothetical protein [Ardenticatenaceae bacterium]
MSAETLLYRLITQQIRIIHKIFAHHSTQLRGMPSDKNHVFCGVEPQLMAVQIGGQTAVPYPLRHHHPKTQVFFKKTPVFLQKSPVFFKKTPVFCDENTGVFG